MLVDDALSDQKGSTALWRTVFLSGFAICDQALFAGTSFAFTILLGRWATDAEFGAFSVAFSVFILLQNVFEGLVFEPFGIFGAGRHAHRLDAYTGRIVLAHLFVAGGLAVPAGLIAFILMVCHETTLAAAFLGMACACPLLLGRILSRQPLYITRRIHWSAAIGGLYFIISVVTLLMLRRLGLVTSFSAFFALGLGSFVASLVVLVGLLKPVWRTQDPELSPRRLVRDHVGYGRWAIGERLLLWLQGNVFFLALPMIVNLQASAVYRALTTLAMPAYMTTAAICAAILPEAVRYYSGSGRANVTHWLLRSLIAGTLAYCLILLAFGRQAAHIAFAGRYDANISVVLLGVAGIGAVLYALASAMEIQLRARQMVRTILVARIASTVFLLVAGTILMQRYQVLGAAVALSLTWVVTAGTYFALSLRRRYANGRIMALSLEK